MTRPDAHTRRLQDAIHRILQQDWDPIGVAGIEGARDEYDGHVSGIHGLLVRRAPRGELIEHLWRIETVRMGLPGNRSRTEAVADQLLRLWHEVEGSD